MYVRRIFQLLAQQTLVSFSRKLLSSSRNTRISVQMLAILRQIINNLTTHFGRPKCQPPNASPSSRRPKFSTHSSSWIHIIRSAILISAYEFAAGRSSFVYPLLIHPRPHQKPFSKKIPPSATSGRIFQIRRRILMRLRKFRMMAKLAHSALEMKVQKCSPFFFFFFLCFFLITSIIPSGKSSSESGQAKASPSCYHFSAKCFIKRPPRRTFP